MKSSIHSLIRKLLLVILFAVVISLSINPASISFAAATNEEIEKAFKDAIPSVTQLPLPKEIRWSQGAWTAPSGSISGWKVQWKGVDTELCPGGKPKGTTHLIECIFYYNSSPVFNTPEDMRAKLLATNKNAKINTSVPGGVSSDSLKWPECYTILHFYKSPYIHASIELSVNLKVCPDMVWPNAASREKYLQEQMKLANAYTTNEAERLAKLILDKLPAADIGASSSTTSPSSTSSIDWANIMGMGLMIFIPLLILTAVGIGIFFLVKFLRRKKTAQPDAATTRVVVDQVQTVPAAPFSPAPAVVNTAQFETISCPSCGKILPSGAELCHHCGSKIEQRPAGLVGAPEPASTPGPVITRCNNCNAKVTSGDTYCPECGNKVER